MVGGFSFLPIGCVEMSDTHMFIEVNGLRFRVGDTREGRPVLLLHGFPDSLELWRYQVGPLSAAGFRCVSPDLRGFGESDKPSAVADYTLPTIMSDVVGIMDELGLERAAVIGHDWGAVVGWLLASFYPDRVDRLTAISVGHPGAFTRGSLEQLQKSWYILLFQFERIAEELWQQDDWRLFRIWLNDAKDSEKYIGDLSRPGALTAGLSWYRANIPVEAFSIEPPAMPPIEVPVLGIWSPGDPYLSERQMIDSEKFVSGPWRYERFDRSGHWIPLDEPERLNRLLLEFLVE